MEQYLLLIDQIKALGSNTRIAIYNFNSAEEAKQACYSIVDNESDIVGVLRSGNGKIANTKFADGANVIFGGLFSADQMNVVHRRMIAAGGKFNIAAMPEKPTWLL